MKSVYCSWKDEEIKKLFSFVERGKRDNLPLIQIFKLFANENGRKPNSVRNYYYMEISELERNDAKMKRLGINLSEHTKSMQTPFDRASEKNMVKSILELCAKGMSVRKACLELSQKDLTLMIRYQNKYRNILKNRMDLLNECVEELRKEGVKVDIKPQKESKSNVLYMPKHNTSLGDKDIEALFMGLVRLVKRVANEQAQSTTKNDLRSANEGVRLAMVKIADKERRIKVLSQNLNRMRAENCVLCEKIKEIRSARANSTPLTSSHKIGELERFAKTLAKTNKSKLKA